VAYLSVPPAHYLGVELVPEAPPVTQSSSGRTVNVRGLAHAQKFNVAMADNTPNLAAPKPQFLFFSLTPFAHRRADKLPDLLTKAVTVT
jgi:hypothetical protein